VAFTLDKPSAHLAPGNISATLGKIDIKMRFISLLGFAAGTLTTLSFIPQVHKAWRTKRCDDLSWTMLIAFGAGIVLWLTYGILLRAAPIIVANAFTLILIVVLLYLKIEYRDRTR
jgi:MtN3 and saliva related transmembrane protein